MKNYFELFIHSFKNYAAYLAGEITGLRWNNYLYWLIGISLFFFMLEVIMPWRKDQKVLRKDFWLDAFYMFFNFFLFSLVGFYAISNVFVTAFNDFLIATFRVKNWVAVETGSWPVWAQLLTLFVVRDFIHWNVHRLLHQVPFLWEFHKVHHSTREMGFATHLRFHWMETVVYRTIEYIPLGMIGFGIQEFFFVHIVALSIGHFNHSNIRVSIGPLKYVFNNPKMHKWHHAKKIPAGHRYGVNYGISLSLWDYFFGTASIPGDGENVELGFEGDEQFPRGFWRQAVSGFRNKAKQEYH